MHHHSCSHHNPCACQTAQKVRLLVTALILVCSFAIAELGIGLFSHSLALLADSGHLASDCFALILALLATWMARRRNSSASRNVEPFGLSRLRSIQVAQGSSRAESRLEVLAALINGVGLVAIALWIGWEAIARLQSPPVEILSLPMLATASVGFGINSVNVLLLHKDSHHDLNLKGVFLHCLADIASSVSVILGAIAVWALDWVWADGAISLLVSTLILLSAVPLILQSCQALFEQNLSLENHR